jgi:hypothetical protein
VKVGVKAKSTVEGRGRILAYERGDKTRLDARTS